MHDEELIACLLPEREIAIRGEELAQRLFARVVAAGELPDSYGFRLADEPVTSADANELIAAERRCCPFLTFELAFSPHGGPVSLRMRGSPRVKAFVADALVMDSQASR